MNIDELLLEREKYKNNALKEFEILEKICFYYKSNNLDQYIYYLNELAGLCKYIGKYDYAKEKVNEALGLISDNYGTNNTNYATTLLTLCEINRFEAKWDNLEEKYLEVLKIFENNKKDKSYEYSGACNNLALFYQSIEENEKAIIYHNKSLEILDMPNHIIEYATSLNNLVMPYKNTNNILKAKETLNECLNIYYKYLDKNNSLIAAALNNQAIISFEEKNIFKAINISKKSLEITKNCFGKNSLNYQNVLENIKYFESLIDYENEKDENLKLIDISKIFTEKYILKEIEKENKEILNHIAIAFIGEGSDVLSLEDEYSKDHDYSFMPLILVDDKKYIDILNEILISLPHEFMGISHIENDNILKRRGVQYIKDYFINYFGKDNVEDGFSIKEYREIKEYTFFAITSGEIFYDKISLREKLVSISYYPDVIREDKLATALSLAFQSGQYNYLRLRKRNDNIASFNALSIFIENIIKTVYLLNRKYTPYYKWQARLLKDLPILGKEIYKSLEILISDINLDMHKISNMIDEICYYISQELQRQNLSKEKTIFLLNHAQYIQRNIKDPYLSLCNSFEC